MIYIGSGHSLCSCSQEVYSTALDVSDIQTYYKLNTRCEVFRRVLLAPSHLSQFPFLKSILSLFYEIVPLYQISVHYHN